MTELTIRPFDPATDYPDFAALLSLVWTAGFTADQLQSHEPQPTPGAVTIRIMACDPSGKVVGFGELSRSPWTLAGVFSMVIATYPEHRRQGIGRRLFHGLSARGISEGGHTAKGYVREEREFSTAFVQAMGLSLARHEFTSELDLATFEETPFLSYVTRAQERGFDFLIIEDPAALDDADVERLHAVHSQTAQDIPGDEEQPFTPLEVYREELRGNRGRRRPSDSRERIVVARQGEQWVGVTILRVGSDHRAYNSHTGVLRDFRVQGLAYALKLLAIREARNLDAVTVRTDNDDENLAMLAVNIKLGYQRRPGWYRVKGPLSA